MKRRLSSQMVWEDDLAYGKAGELMALEMIEYDEVVYAPDRQFPDYDFTVRHQDDWIPCEVKRDSYTKRTGNIVIEFSSAGKPSGIATTKSVWYIYIVDGEPSAYFIPTQRLREAIANKEYYAIRRVAEGGKNEAYFFDRALFAEYLHTP